MKLLKKGLLTEIAQIEANILLAKIGVKLDVNSPENAEESSEGRKIVLHGLQTSKEKIRMYLQGYEKLIDEAIEQMS